MIVNFVLWIVKKIKHFKEYYKNICKNVLFTLYDHIFLVYFNNDTLKIEVNYKDKFRRKMLH